MIPPEAAWLAGLPPVIDDRAKVLILGSFPSAASLRAGQYYAHPRNHFWPILSAIVGQDLVAMDYPGRLRLLGEAGIGVWDVYAGCLREGSLDADIRAGQWNDLTGLISRHQNLRRICFNGSAAAACRRRMAWSPLDLVTLPSTSPANARVSFRAKLDAWRDGVCVPGS